VRVQIGVGDAGCEVRRVGERRLLVTGVRTPERTAPTVIGAGTPSPAPMPTKATPRVPTVVHEEPMANATTAATTAAAGRNVVGERISSP